MLLPSIAIALLTEDTFYQHKLLQLVGQILRQKVVASKREIMCISGEGLDGNMFISQLEALEQH